MHPGVSCAGPAARALLCQFGRYFGTICVHSVLPYGSSRVVQLVSCTALSPLCGHRRGSPFSQCIRFLSLPAHIYRSYFARTKY